MFLGFSPTHSSTVSLALNSSTGSVSPQFHVVHDKLFTTIPNHSFDNMTALWDELCSVSRGNDWEQEVNEFGKEIPVPIVSSDWKDDTKLKELQEKDKLSFRRLYNRELYGSTSNDFLHTTSNSISSPQ